MHPRYQELIEHLDRNRAALHTAVESVPAQHHVTSPADGRWSVLGVLEHLAIVERRVSTMLNKQIVDAKAAMPMEMDETPILPRLNLAMFTDRTRKIKGSDATEPKFGQQLDQLWRSLGESLAAIRQLLVTADGMCLSNVTMPHPIFGPLDLYTWFAFIGSHEARHAEQIREIGAMLSGR